MKPIRLLLLGLLLVSSAGAARAIDVDAEGQAAILGGNVASARRQALVNAQRNAVEQGVGLILDAKTLTQNFQVIQDQILTSSQGLVTKHTILREGRTPDGQSFSVTIRATVAKDLLEDRLSALRILHKSMGNKRVMVVYQSSNPNALDRNHGATTAALQAIQDQLNKSGFRVFNPEATEQVYKQIEAAGRINRAVEDLIAMALDQRADLLVRFENVAGKRGSGGGAFSSAFSTIRISVYDTNTGRQVADTQVDDKQLLRGNAGPYDWEKGLADASSKAAQAAAQEAIAKIADYYKGVGDTGTAFLVVFRGFEDKEKDAILDYLENTPGFKQLSERKNTIGYLEIELFSSEEGSRLRRLIRAGLKEKGIDIATQATSGNRLLFTNPRKPE
jgi:hypothetical protein